MARPMFDFDAKELIATVPRGDKTRIDIQSVPNTKNDEVWIDVRRYQLIDGEWTPTKGLMLKKEELKLLIEGLGQVA